MNKKIREQSVEKRTLKMGRYTMTEVIDIETGKSAVGVSRKSSLDRYDDKAALGIAEGRALKALALKKAGKHLTHIFMG